MDTSVTASDIINHMELIKTQLQDPVVREKLKIYEKQQLNNEEILISNNQICGNDNLISLKEHITNLKPDILKKDVDTQFYNAQVMRAAMCAIDSVIYSPPEDIGSAQHNNLVNRYVKNLRQIGTESVNGYAMLGSFDGIEDFFVVKVSRNPLNDTLVHELVVGLYGTNKMRDLNNPNFSYIYAGLKCSPPLIDPNTKKVVYSCLDNFNLVNYVLYENVAPAKSIRDYVKTCTSKQFLNVFMQALYALRLANIIVDYTHYDLHAENLLIRDPKLFGGKMFQIPYETENGNEYLTTDVISTFIDYGYSHIKTEDIVDEKNGVIFKGQDFGVHGRIHLSIFPNRSWIIYDAYRLLMNCMGYAYDNNNISVLKDMKNIFKFFNNINDPIIFMENRVPDILPLIEKTENLQLDDLTRHIRSVCDCSFITSSPSSDPILDCGDLCPSEKSILADVGLNVDDEIKIPNNIRDFDDLIQVLSKQNNKEKLDYIIDNYNYIDNIENHLDDIDQQYKLLKVKVVDFYNSNTPDITKINYDSIFSYKGLSKIRQPYIDMGEIFNIIEKLNNDVNIGLCTAELYDDDNTIHYLNELSININEVVNTFELEANYIIFSYGDYLDNITDDDYYDIIDNDKRLEWYWSDRLSLQNTFLNLMKK